MASATRRLGVRTNDRSLSRATFGKQRRDVIGRTDLRKPSNVVGKHPEPVSVDVERFPEIVRYLAALVRSFAAAVCREHRSPTQAGSISKLRSAAGAECVSAPMD